MTFSSRTSPSLVSRAAVRRFLLVSAAASVLFAASSHADDLPTGGNIVAGSGNIAVNGNTMDITQTTHGMAADWTSFSIGQGHTVNFHQPSSNAVALNRVVGNDVSEIRGNLNANGHVFLVNPNGVLFGDTAQVNVGGIVASTQNIDTDEFMDGRYVFEGESTGAIINHGNIKAANGGTVALVAAKIVNTGSITADEGNVLMGAGNRVTIDMGGPVKLDVSEGALETLIEQGGAVRAQGGEIYMSAKAAGDLASSVINHTGITEAQTLSTGKTGKIVLIGDMEQGHGNFGGKLDASAPAGGNGGFIETSAAYVEQLEGLEVTASSRDGDGGEWLIDPYNYTINNTAASNIVSTLNGGTNVTITTASNVANHGSSGDSSQIGDITVSSAIAKTGNVASTLTLRAANSIIVNADITSTNSALNLELDADNDSGARDGGGVIILSRNISTHGGNVNFGTGATATLNGVSTMVGGDVFVDGSSAQTINTGGGHVTVNGEMLVGNTNGLSINTGNGNATFKGIINSGNRYAAVSSAGMSWDTARAHARSGTGENTGDTYLATITSRLENAIAGRAGAYAVSWLGGQRVTGIGTNNLWRWVEGPESKMDGGRGLAFFSQNGSDSSNGIGGTPYNGGYSNWNPSEPNNSNGANLTAANETALQFVGNLGKWNDLPRSGELLEQYIRETNLADSPLSINAGSGSVTFGAAVGGTKTLSTLDVTAGGGINVNGGLVRTSGVQNYNSNVTLGSASTTLETTGANTDFTLAANRVISHTGGSAASLTLKSARAVILESGSGINATNAALNTSLWSDSDATNGGYIWMKADSGTGASINTHGGSITLSGGGNLASGHATGVDGVHGNGVTLDSATLNSGGGNIVVRGRSANNYTAYASTDAGPGTNANGIRMHGSNVIDSGIGAINLVGVARSTDGASNAIETNQTGYSKILSAATNQTAITLNGSANAGSSTSGWGVFLWGTDVSGILLAATGTGGGVQLEGVGRNTTNGGGVHIEPNAYVLAASGPINIVGTKGATSTYEDVVLNGTVGYAQTLPAGFGASPVTASSSNIIITADTLGANRIFGGRSIAGSAVQSSGALMIRQRTIGKALKVGTANPADGSVWVDPTPLFGSSGLVKTGFSKVIFGNGDTGQVVLDNYTFDNDTEINSNGAVSLGTVNVANRSLLVNVSDGGAITQTGALTAQGLRLSAATSAVTLNNPANAVGTLAANVGSLTFRNGAGLKIGYVDGMHGALANGKIDIATTSGNITLERNVQSLSTASDAVVLNAGSSESAGTATGGNIVVNGNWSVSTGAGGRATLYTGSTTDSTGVAALAGAGHYRYNSDESATNYTSALAGGTYAIYREAPTVTVTSASVNKDYDGTVYAALPSVTYDGFVNGEDESVLGGTLALAGTANGAKDAGSYTISAGGLSDGLGYTLDYADGTLDIDKLTLTYTASPLIALNGSALDLRGGVSGFISGENVSNATTGVMAFTTSADAMSPAGVYEINGGGLSATNYNFVQHADNATALTLLRGYQPAVTPIQTSPAQGAIQTAQSVPTQIMPTATLPGVIHPGANPTLSPVQSPVQSSQASQSSQSSQSGGASSQPGQGSGQTAFNAVGTMEVVEMRSSDEAAPGNAGFVQASAQENANYKAKMFVIDGGIRLPEGLNEDND